MKDDEKKFGMAEDGAVTEVEVLSREAVEITDQILASIEDDPLTADFKVGLRRTLHGVLANWPHLNKVETRRVALRIADKMVTQWTALQSYEAKASMTRILARFVKMLDSTEEAMVVKAREPEIIEVNTDPNNRAWRSFSLEVRKDVVGKRFGRQIKEIIDSFATIDEVTPGMMGEYMELGDKIVLALADLDADDLLVPEIVSVVMIGIVRQHFGMKTGFCMNNEGGNGETN